MYKKLFILVSLVFVIACGGGNDDLSEPPTKPDPVLPDPNEPGTKPEEPKDTKIYVASAAEFNALTELKAGDTIVLRNNTYTDVTLQINATATEASPIVVTGESASKVILTGKSSIKIGGSHIVVRDIWFKDVLALGNAVIELRIDSKNLANNCRITNCAITDTNSSEDLTKGSKWVSIYGEGHTIDHCRFTNKKNMGTLMVVWLGASGNGRHKIINNYFSRPHSNVDENNAALNDQETIRMGDSSSSMQETSCTVEDNHFYQCNAEMEAISNKSCKNVYRNNLLEECKAALTLRQGNGCTVESNYFLGNDVEHTGGIRVIGEDHTVKGNYFERLKGSGYRTAICIIRGIPDSPLSGYFQVKNARIESNIILNCSYGISVNYGSGKQTLPAISTVISNNTISNESTSNTSVIYEATPGTGVTWSANVMYGGKYTGIAQSAVAASTAKPTISSQATKYNAIKAGAGISWTTN